MKKGIKNLLDLIFPRPKHPTLNQPGLHLRWRIGWIKGWVFRPYWKTLTLLGIAPKIYIGRRFSLIGRFIPRGPGKLFIGDDVIVSGITTPFTHSSNAEIHIGNAVFLNGTRFGASESILVGDECILADARIMDTDFHSTGLNRNSPTAPIEVRPIRIERNVWVAAQAAVLKGVRIGEGSVVGFGAVVTRSIPPAVIVSGNPAQTVKALNKVTTNDRTTIQQ